MVCNLVISFVTNLPVPGSAVGEITSLVHSLLTHVHSQNIIRVLFSLWNSLCQTSASVYLGSRIQGHVLENEQMQALFHRLDFSNHVLPYITVQHRGWGIPSYHGDLCGLL
jgi:hypothetical protein